MHAFNPMHSILKHLCTIALSTVYIAYFRNLSSKLYFVVAWPVPLLR